jgi:hypothetical protein
MTTLERPAVEGRNPPAWTTALGNPLLHWLLTRSRPPKALTKELMVLRFRGRTTGKPYELVVARYDLDGTMFTTTKRRWRFNMRGGAEVELVLEGHRRPARAVLVEDPDEVARIYLRLLERVGHRRASRVGLRVNVDRLPTVEELRVAVVEAGLALIRYELP